MRNLLSTARVLTRRSENRAEGATLDDGRESEEFARVGHVADRVRLLRTVVVVRLDSLRDRQNSREGARLGGGRHAGCRELPDVFGRSCQTRELGRRRGAQGILSVAWTWNVERFMSVCVTVEVRGAR